MACRLKEMIARLNRTMVACFGPNECLDLVLHSSSSDVESRVDAA